MGLELGFPVTLQTGRWTCKQVPPWLGPNFHEGKTYVLSVSEENKLPIQLLKAETQEGILIPPNA